MTILNSFLRDHQQSKESTRLSVYLVCGFAALIVLAIDLHIPLGIAAGIPYIIVILLSLKSPENRFTVISALICTLLVVIGYFASPPAPDHVPFLQVFANRVLTIAAIWIVALMALIQRNQTNALHQAQMINLKSLKDAEIQAEKLRILKATMRTVQDITGNFLNSLQYFTLEIENKQTLSPESVKKLDALIHETAGRINAPSSLEQIREKKLAGDMIGIDYEHATKGNSALDSDHSRER